jgi:hypothetical protein
MIVKPQPRSPVIIAISLPFLLKYLSASTALELDDYRNPYLALEIHGSRAYQIAFIVRLLQRRRGLVSHHGRTVRELPFAGS